MGGRQVLGTIRLTGFDAAWGRALLLAALFLTGALLGHVYAGYCGAADGPLAAYLRDYCTVYDSGGAAVSMGSCLALYFGYVAAAFLLGFASIGAVLIPALSGVFGFVTMYTISCFARAYGRGGVLLALAALGMRLVFCLPCFFAVAGEAWGLSTDLFLLAFGRGKRSAPVLYGSRYFLLFVLCTAILAAGVCCERFLTPVLFRMALGVVL